MATCHLTFYDHRRDDHCNYPEHGRALELRRRASAASAPEWGRIERTDDRDFLDGRPVHCGDGLQLQITRWEVDEYGDVPILLPAGVPVRYELASGGHRQRPIVLYIGLAGHQVAVKFEDWMRFRWAPSSAASTTTPDAAPDPRQLKIPTTDGR